MRVITEIVGQTPPTNEAYDRDDRLRKNNQCNVRAKIYLISRELFEHLNRLRVNLKERRRLKEIPKKLVRKE